ncbi:glycosyltransferase family 4 protein [Herbiconiux daphne]|uniref:Glycosyltransferase family 4 protein n=1 Tax=Herbiconiux daphne TaxID=2970914 RepID=A0ABT2H4M5_9MICO|nr:glycosyltransferase family 1 protein [Herbiconiux daphne]MCS5734885.1 glycosyltransferase family 4 protein [Herbiconiux daphne]
MSPHTSVLFDATSLPPNWGGVARYIQGVLAGLDELGVSVHVVAKPADIARLRDAAPGHRYHPAPAAIRARPVRFAWEQLGLPRLARTLGATVIHSPHYTLPLVSRAANVVTLHDATFFTDPEVHSRLKRTFFTWWTRRAAGRAAVLITPSRATADAVRASIRDVRAAMLVAYLGVDPAVFHVPASAEVERFAREHALDSPTGWIAFLGTIEPRKNVPALLRAHALLRERLGSGTPTLVLSGSRGWDEDAATRLDALTPTDLVVEAGYLPLDDLPAFLGGASVVAYPSLGEGFGLPVLEAMACGAAVLTTRRLSIPEVGGDAVAYTEPDSESIAAALETLLAEPERRAGLASQAAARSTEFTWLACARVHLDAYERAGAAA